MVAGYLGDSHLSVILQKMFSFIILADNFNGPFVGFVVYFDMLNGAIVIPIYMDF